MELGIDISYEILNWKLQYSPN